MAVESAAVDALSFEQAMAELEGIVRALETGKSDLARAIADYERGTTLRRHCESMLAEAEMKVQAIVEGRAGDGTTAITLREVE